MENNLRSFVNVTLADWAYMPERAHYNDAGADLRTPEAFVLKAHSSHVWDTGVGMQIPDGWFGKLESKSGLSVKSEIVCPGGVIDSGFRGTIKVRMKNDSDTDYAFEKGEKVVQIVILPCLLCDFRQVGKLDPAERGASGYGSTGRR